MDIANIEPGLDFREAIERGVEKCDVFLPIIGQRWINIEDHKGRRRLDIPTDAVRLETRAALEREGLRVIPVLVQGARMPTEEDLPEGIGGLAYRSAQELSDTRWQFDVDRLIQILERVREQIGEPAGGQLRRPDHEPRAPSGDLSMGTEPDSRGPGDRSDRWTWSDYENHSPHAADKMAIVRTFVEAFSKQSGWAPQLWKNQIGFRSDHLVPLRVQFWGQEVRIALLTKAGRRPEPDPLKGLRGGVDSYGNWIWRLDSSDQVPQDLSPLIDLLLNGEVEQEPPSGDENSLREKMLEAYTYLSRRHRYNATYFLRLVKERGAKSTAETLLRSRDQYSDGFLKLVELKELEHSVEALVLRPEYRHMFNEQELAEARHRLQVAQFDTDNWEDKPWA